MNTITYDKLLWTDNFPNESNDVEVIPVVNVLNSLNRTTLNKQNKIPARTIVKTRLSFNSVLYMCIKSKTLFLIGIFAFSSPYHIKLKTYLKPRMKKNFIGTDSLCRIKFQHAFNQITGYTRINLF